MSENLFGDLRVYGGGYTVKSSRSFNQKEIDQVSYAKVVPSQYGMSVCFYMRAGFQHYVPVSRDSNCVVGDIVDLTKATILKLSKDGEKDIDRIEIIK